MTNLPLPDASTPVVTPKEKKKWYKKWWVWAIVVVLVAVSNSQSKTSETSGEVSGSAKLTEDTSSAMSEDSETTVTTAESTTTTTTTTTTIPEIQIPEAQKQFIAMIEEGRKKIDEGKTDLQKASALRDRDKALCTVISSYKATDWIGEVDEIGANGEGKAHISITIAEDVKVRTWNNAIRFSAKFLQGRDTCLKQGNLMDFYYGRKPEFVVQITNVELIK